MIATASLSGSVIKMVAASSEWRDAGLSGQVISALMNTARADGRHKFFIYTKPEAAPKFSALGFRELATSKNSVLMECGAHGMNEFRAALEAERAKNGPQAGAAVMNCNPFTLGHQFLIEEGAKQCPLFYVIVVEEDASAFPFEDRLALVREGTAHIPNVRVLTSGSYAVSKATSLHISLKTAASCLWRPNRRRLERGSSGGSSSQRSASRGASSGRSILRRHRALQRNAEKNSSRIRLRSRGNRKKRKWRRAGLCLARPRDDRGGSARARSASPGSHARLSEKPARRGGRGEAQEGCAMTPLEEVLSGRDERAACQKRMLASREGAFVCQIGSTSPAFRSACLAT